MSASHADLTAESMALADLLATVAPGHRAERWSWEDEAGDIAIRLCLCCGQVGHYQETVESSIAEHGLTAGVCIGEDGRLHDGHHRVVAAKALGIERVPLETKVEADARWRRDHGSCVWELRQFGDVHPGAAWDHVQNFRQAARDFVAREALEAARPEPPRERFAVLIAEIESWTDEELADAVAFLPAAKRESLRRFVLGAARSVPLPDKEQT